MPEILTFNKRSHASSPPTPAGDPALKCEAAPQETLPPPTINDGVAFGRGIPYPIEAAVACTVLIISLPLLILAGVIIKLTSHGAILFCQPRVGQGGRVFTMYKLRTMRSATAGAQVTAANDIRVTSVGRVLRKTKLDELPELWNIINGDLSLVGARPEVPRYVDMHNPLWRRVLVAKPGITDPVTLRLRNEEQLLASIEGDTEVFYTQVLQPYKLAGYLAYLERRTVLSDVTVLSKTVCAIVLPQTTPPPTLDEIKLVGNRYAAKNVAT